MITVSALEGRLELAHEEVHQVRVISPDVTLPGLYGLLTYARIIHIIFICDINTLNSYVN